MVNCDAPDLPSADAVARLVADLRTTSPVFEALLARYGRAAPALRHYGLLRWQSNPLDAVEPLRAALALTPEDPNLWRDLAGAYEGGMQLHRAEPCIQIALHHRPDDAAAWLMLANLQNRTGRSDAAETAFGRAIALDPASGDAHFGLGLLHYAKRALDPAAASVARAIAHGYSNVVGYATLGHIVYLNGQFGQASAQFEQATRLGPVDENTRRKHARSRTFQAMIEGDPQDALAAYPQIAGADAEDPAIILRDAFFLLCAHGYTTAAIAVGRMRLAQDPGDPSQRYLLDAVSGVALHRAPTDYLEHYFDRFAASFDETLVRLLDYAVPQAMARLVAQHRATFSAMLDLGCGTGLAAAHLAPLGLHLTGVDISGRMLEQAAKRDLYRSLVKDDVLAFLATHPARYDLIFAADLLIYFGALDELFEGLAQSCLERALVTFSIETTLGADFKLLPSGRFAHDVAYVERVASQRFSMLERQPTMLRLEAARPTDGVLFVLERKPEHGSP